MTLDGRPPDPPPAPGEEEHGTQHDTVPALPDLSAPHAVAALAPDDRAALEAHAAAYALDALTPDETADYERHLAECAFCRALAESERELAASLAHAAGPPVVASAGLKARILAAAAAGAPPAAATADGVARRGVGGARLADAPRFAVPSVGHRSSAGLQTIGATASPLTPAPARTGAAGGAARPWLNSAPRTPLYQWATLGLLACTLGLGAWNVSLQRSADAVRQRTTQYEAALAAAAGGRVVPLGGTGQGAPPSEGRVALIAQDSGESRLVVAGLPDAPAGHDYQLWLIQDGTPRDAGTFSGSATGVETVAVKGDPARAHVVAVTVEPKGGSQAPTSQPILAARL